MKAYRAMVVVVAAGCCAASVSLASAQETSWVGEMVLPTKRANDIKLLDRIDGKKAKYPYNGQFPLRVRAERDGKLLIHDGHREGWVDKADFVLGRDGPAYFHRRVNANPKDTFALFMRAAGWMQKGEPDNAIPDLNECIRLDPTDASAYISRGNAYAAKRDYDKAMRDYDEAIRLDAKHMLAFNNRGLLYLAQKEYDKAMKDFDEAIRLDPKHVLPWSNRAVIWRIKKEYEKAIKDYNEVLRLDSKNVNALSERGHIWRTTKEFDKAIKDYDEVLRLEPKNAVVLMYRAWSWSSKGEHARAVKDCDAAIAVAPKYAWAHHIRATALMLMRQREAAAGFQQVIDLEGGKGALSPYAVIMGYFTFRHAGDDAAAKMFLKEAAAKLDESWPYAVVKFLRGELDEAALLKLATDNDMQTVAHCFLGMDHAVYGRTDKALAHFRWVKEHGSTTWVQYTVGVAELRRLEQAPKGTDR